MSTNDELASGDRFFRDADVRTVCSILESISKNFAPGSPEADAIRDATTAYIAVHQRNVLAKRFVELRQLFAGQIPDDLNERLRRHGIDPNDFEDESSDGSASN